MFTFQADTSPFGHGGYSALNAGHVVAGEFERLECATGYGNAESTTIPDNSNNREFDLVIWEKFVGTLTLLEVRLYAVRFVALR